MAVFCWRNLNLAICTCNCTYDIISFTLWHNLCTFSGCMAYASSPNVWIENGDFEVESCIRGYHVKSIWNSTTGRIELCARKDEHWGSLCCAVIRRSAVVGHVPWKKSATCVLRRNHLRLVLFITLEYRAVTKNLVARVCVMCMWVVHIKLTSFLLLGEFRTL